MQLYLQDKFGSVVRPIIELKDFQKVRLQPGETKTLTFVIDNEKLAFIIIYMGRISRGFLYWYFTKATKANGTVFIRREIPPLSDPLKFSIALDFMKKNDSHLCLGKLF